MALTPVQIERMVDANAAALGLSIAAEYRRGVLGYVALAAVMAELVDGLTLGPADESGNVFVPVVPSSE